MLAARWGMPNASAFTRSFRSAYGLTARDHRRQALSARDAAPAPATPAPRAPDGMR
ncbi:hypothetical protein GCM10017752_01670 [Streptomyces roseoviridis]